MPCDLAMAQALLDRRDRNGILPGEPVPGWPTEDFLNLAAWYVQHLLSDPSLMGWGPWLMVLRRQEIIIGDLGFHDKPDKNGKVEIGYQVNAAYRRRGFASESVRVLVGWALSHPEVVTVIAHCREDNAASNRVLQKLGMRETGREVGTIAWEITKEEFALRYRECGR